LHSHNIENFSPLALENGEEIVVDKVSASNDSKFSEELPNALNTNKKNTIGGSSLASNDLRNTMNENKSSTLSKNRLQ